MGSMAAEHSTHDRTVQPNTQKHVYMFILFHCARVWGGMAPRQRIDAGYASQWLKEACRSRHSKIRNKIVPCHAVTSRRARYAMTLVSGRHRAGIPVPQICTHPSAPRTTTSVHRIVERRISPAIIVWCFPDALLKLDFCLQCRRRSEWI